MVGITSAIGAVAGVAGSLLGASSSNKAVDKANAAQQAAITAAQGTLTDSYNTSSSALKSALDQSIDYQNSAYETASSALSPYASGGTAATSQINALLGLTGSTEAQQAAFDTYKDSTGYQSRLQEGYDAVNSNYAANGLLQSGAAQKALTEYGQNFASNEFSNYMGYLTGQQNTGLSASSSLANLSTNYGNALSGLTSNYGTALSNLNSNYGSNIANLQVGAGNANANAAIAKGTNTANMWSGIGSTIGGVLGSL